MASLSSVYITPKIKKEKLEAYNPTPDEKIDYVNNQKQYLNALFNTLDRSKASTKLGISIIKNEIDFRHGKIDGKLVLPIRFIANGVMDTSYLGIKIEYGHITTPQQIERILLHVVMSTEFKELSVHHNRYYFDFKSLHSALLEHLITAIFNSNSKRINYTWIAPLQELVIERQLTSFKTPKKIKEKKLGFKTGGGLLDALGRPTPKEIFRRPKIRLTPEQVDEEIHERISRNGKLTIDDASELGLPYETWINYKKSLDQLKQRETINLNYILPSDAAIYTGTTTGTGTTVAPSTETLNFLQVAAKWSVFDADIVKDRTVSIKESSPIPPADLREFYEDEAAQEPDPFE